MRINGEQAPSSRAVLATPATARAPRGTRQTPWHCSSTPDLFLKLDLGHATMYVINRMYPHIALVLQHDKEILIIY